MELKILKQKEMEEYIGFLNDLTDREFRIFICSKCFGRSQEQISKDLKMSKRDVNSIYKELNIHAGFIGLKERILEAFLI